MYTAIKIHYNFFKLFTLLHTSHFGNERFHVFQIIVHTSFIISKQIIYPLLNIIFHSLLTKLPICTNFRTQKISNKCQKISIFCFLSQWKSKYITSYQYIHKNTSEIAFAQELLHNSTLNTKFTSLILCYHFNLSALPDCQIQSYQH